MLMTGTDTAHSVENLENAENAVLTVTEAAALWDVEPGYLNTSSYGPPPRPAWDALQRSLDDWRYRSFGRANNESARVEPSCIRVF